MILGNLLSLLEQEWPHKILSNVNHSVILRWHWIMYYSWAHFLREEATPLESESRTLSPSVPSITCPISEIFLVQCGKFEESESIHSEFNITSFHRTAKSKTAGKIASSSWCPFILICKKKKAVLFPETEELPACLILSVCKKILNTGYGRCLYCFSVTAFASLRKLNKTDLHLAGICQCWYAT